MSEIDIAGISDQFDHRDLVDHGTLTGHPRFRLGLRHRLRNHGSLFISATRACFIFWSFAGAGFVQSPKSPDANPQ